MDCDFPSIYRSAYEDAERRDELKEYAKSFRLKVGCACAIEHDIRACAIGNGLQAGCVDMTLERYGFQRVSFVLANSLCKMEHPESIREDVLAWGEQIYVPPDGDNNRYYAVDAATPLLEAFIGQVRETYQTLGLFGPEHCVNSEKGLDYTGKVLVLSPNTLKESCWSPLNQLWLGETGFGCSPTASGRAVYATCLGDGEQTRWNRADFIGVLDEQYLPDWAREKLEELTQGQRPQGPEQTGPTMNM